MYKDFENSFPSVHTRFVSRPVSETTLICIRLLYEQPLLSYNRLKFGWGTGSPVLHTDEEHISFESNS